jgi:hypothetical protein
MEEVHKDLERQLRRQIKIDKWRPLIAAAVATYTLVGTFSALSYGQGGDGGVHSASIFAGVMALMFGLSGAALGFLGAATMTISMIVISGYAGAPIGPWTAVISFMFPLAIVCSPPKS